MKGKNKSSGSFSQGIDHENDSNVENPSAKNKKQGHKVHTDKFAANWESDEELESYSKGKAHAHGGRHNR